MLTGREPADLDARAKELQAESVAKKDAAKTIAELNAVVKKLQADSERAAAQAESNQEAAKNAEDSYKSRQAKVCAAQPALVEAARYVLPSRALDVGAGNACGLGLYRQLAGCITCAWVLSLVRL